jgi:N utilization substance protein B
VSTSRESDDGHDLPVGERRRSRERALGLLYEAEVKNLPLQSVLDGLPSVPEPYAVDLVLGVAHRCDEIDALIDLHADFWAIERMPAVDRQLLRLATYELMEQLDVPVAVVIDEAVELAKQYSTEDSGSYVNGVLASIARKLRKEGGEAP